MKSLLSGLKGMSRSTQKGFSLMEIIIVLAIIGMLMGIIVSRIVGGRESANISLTGTRAASLYGKIIQYQLMNNNAFPEKLDVLETGPSPLIQHEEATDAWGTDFCYTTAGDDVFLGSKGKAKTDLTFCFKNGKQQPDSTGCSC